MRSPRNSENFDRQRKQTRRTTLKAERSALKLPAVADGRIGRAHRQRRTTLRLCVLRRGPPMPQPHCGEPPSATLRRQCSRRRTEDNDENVLSSPQKNSPLWLERPNSEFKSSGFLTGRERKETTVPDLYVSEDEDSNPCQHAEERVVRWKRPSITSHDTRFLASTWEG